MSTANKKTPPQPFRILLVDDHIVTRQGIRLLLEKQGHLKVIAEAENGREAIKSAAAHKPDIVIMDISMPELNGIEATRQILETDPNIKVIALSSHYSPNFVKKMIKAGALAYIDKNGTLEELNTAIETAIKGRHFMSKPIADIVMKELKNQLFSAEGDNEVNFSKREHEVLQLIAEGLTTKEIASKLNVSTKTVEANRRQIMEKLKLNSIAELTKYAVREGLTSLDI